MVRQQNEGLPSNREQRDTRARQLYDLKENYKADFIVEN